MNIIEIKDLEKSFKKIKAVDYVNIEVKQGEILGILGPNGAGKSTTISMIASLVSPDNGQILFRGKNILKHLGILRKSLGLVPQEVALYPDLSALENLKFFGKLYNLKGQELQKRVEEVIELMELKDRAKDKVKTYSGGMKRRVNIGAALLHNPEILIMDEPTVGIDPQSRNYILQTVKDLSAKGITIIYTSHYMEEVEFLCDRIYIMDYGKIIACGTKDYLKGLIDKHDTVEINTRGLNNNFIDELKNNNKIKHINIEENKITMVITDNENILSEILAAADNNKVNVKSLQTKVPTLEDVFLHLTGRGLRN